MYSRLSMSDRCALIAYLILCIACVVIVIIKMQ